jgi:hypothetical protein
MPDESNGEMSEWLKEHAWKACVGETLPRVRIPLSPPTFAALKLAKREGVLGTVRLSPHSARIPLSPPTFAKRSLRSRLRLAWPRPRR